MAEDSGNEGNEEIIVDTEVPTDEIITTDSPPETNWYDNLDVGYKNDANITKYKSLDDFAKGYTSQSKMIGADKVLLPKEGDEYDSQMDEYFSKVGMPETAEGYGLENIDLSENGLEQVIETGAFAEAARGLRLTKEQAAGVMEFYKEDVINSITQNKEVATAQLATDRAGLRKEYGAAFEGNMQQATALFKNSFPSLAGSGLENNPALVRDLVKLSKNFGETTLGNTPKGQAMTPADANVEADKLMLTDAYSNPLHPEHKGTVDKFRALLEMASK